MPALIPGYLLKKLYVKGSFKNTPNGFELSLRNTLAPGTLIGFGPLKIDGQDIPLNHVLISVGNAPAARASEISRETPRAFPLNSAVNFRVEDEQSLTPGSHRLTLAVNTKEAGELKIDVEDAIA